VRDFSYYTKDHPNGRGQEPHSEKAFAPIQIPERHFFSLNERRCRVEVGR
jgi:hypothetical protein